MKKKLFSLLTALVLCLLCAVPAFAEMPLVMDTYELFKPEATAELEQKAQDASAGHGVNVYLLTVSDIGGQNVREFAKDWYRDYDLGYGEGKSGILFLIALDSRDYVTITYGGGVTAFTDYRIAQIEDKIVPMLSDGTYYKASETYIEMCADTLDFYAEKGAPLDSGNDPAKETESLTRLIDAGVDGLVVNTCGGKLPTSRPMPTPTCPPRAWRCPWWRTPTPTPPRPKRTTPSRTTARAARAARVPTATVSAAARAENSKLYRSHCRECSTSFSARSVLCAKNRYAFQTIYITNAAKDCDSVSRSLAAYLFGLLWLTVISGSPSA